MEILVQPLRRDVDVDSAVPVGDREAGLGPEEGGILAADVVDAATDTSPSRRGRRV